MHKYRKRKRAGVITAAAIIIDIAMLGIFKYSGFIVENINALTGLGLDVPKIRLPIGISFFTFQMISYMFFYHINASVIKDN
jgi:alginate O-acetyltransferase complex protein AlgI